MSKISQQEKALKGMAGEFLVAGELNRRRIHAAVTFGSSKRADVFAFAPASDRLARIEVKSTTLGNKKWVLSQKVLDRDNWSAQVFWVLVLLPEPHPATATTSDEIRGSHAPRFFVFTAKEIGEHVTELHDNYVRGFRERHGREFKGPGVLQIPRDDAQAYENKWNKIQEFLEFEKKEGLF